ncbi:hypothetical protein CYMTET_53049 [Cymbomonas tetramitiformis]|uniref:RING-type domain-containing protein n=1 Tax=Cymbomonas tetramitiformis TaxID=36881 RepID=A0AAE0BHS6_9CHLO|nr:hypothetical protein CYMTET_53049 [Cymbomonas tetramitiformis]
MEDTTNGAIEKIEATRLIEEEEDDATSLFSCVVCRTYVVLPAYGCGLYTENEECDHLYCKDCLTASLQVKKLCPQCLRPAKKKTCVEEGERNCVSSYLRPFKRAETSEANRLLFKCVNWEHGCSETVKLANMAAHEKQCANREKACPFCSSLFRDCWYQHLLAHHPSEDEQLRRQIMLQLSESGPSASSASRKRARPDNSTDENEDGQEDADQVAEHDMQQQASGAMATLAPGEVDVVVEVVGEGEDEDAAAAAAEAEENEFVELYFGSYEEYSSYLQPEHRNMTPLERKQWANGPDGNDGHGHSRRQFPLSPHDVSSVARRPTGPPPSVYT